MEYIVSAEEMKNCDRVTSEKYGLPSMVLMERAALGVMDVILEKEKSSDISLSKILVVCGVGNNGGDGFAIGRLLLEKNQDVDFVLIGDRSKCTAETNAQIRIVEMYGKSVLSSIPEEEYTLIIDALFGISLNRKVEGNFFQAIHKMNEGTAKRISIDIPSGIQADTGKVLGIAVKSDYTVTFAYYKIGHMLYPGLDFCGEIIRKDIGTVTEALIEKKPSVFTFAPEEIKLPQRPDYANKSTFGKVLLIAGGINMAGAAILSAKAAYRTGAGVVRVYTPEGNRQIIQTAIPEAVLTTYEPGNFHTESLKEALEWCDCVGIGPGIGQGPEAYNMVQYVLKNAGVPVLIDADGLNIVAMNINELADCGQELIVTPHLGEMSRLTGVSVKEIAEHLIDIASDFAGSYRLTCVLKDTRTIVADDKKNVYINRTGNNGMATAGSGDVLAGIICGLVASGMNGFQAACMGVACHGAAGDRGILRKGLHGLMAGDIIEGLCLL